MNLHWIDYSLVATYFVLIIYIGFFASKRKAQKKSDFEDYLLAGRRLSLPLFVATLVSTWYGNILGIGEFIYTSGIVGWVCFGLPYYISAAIFAFFAAGKIRKYNFKTIPEQITSRYGMKAGWLASLIVLIITIPAAYILILGVIIQVFSGIDLWLSIIIGAVLSLVYLFTGGFRADVYTNTAQFVLMYIGMGVLVIFSIISYGLPDVLSTRLPETHLTFAGGKSWQFILVWFLISLQTFVDPSFHQRCAAAKKPVTARNGILISIIFWMLFDSFTLFSGLYARAFIHIDNPVMTYLILGDKILPVFWKGIFIIAMLATVMSTLDSYSFISAATIGNDILNPILQKIKRFQTISLESLTKFGLLLTSIFGVGMAILLPSAVGLIYKTASIAVPGLLVPLIFSYSKNYRLSKIMLIMFSGVCISGIWTIISILVEKKIIIFNNNIFNDIEPMFSGLVISIILGIIFIRKNLT